MRQHRVNRGLVSRQVRFLQLLFVRREGEADLNGLLLAEKAYPKPISPTRHLPPVLHPLADRPALVKYILVSASEKYRSEYREEEINAENKGNDGDHAEAQCPKERFLELVSACRKGDGSRRCASPAGENARKIPGIEWPVLRMKDLQGETLAVNVPGSSRWKVETLMKKNLVSCKLMELPDFTNRIMMVEAGKASLLTNLYTSMEQNIEKDRLFLIHPEENILSVMALACRQNFQTDPRFRAVLEGIRLCFPETRPAWYRAFLQEQLAQKNWLA